MGFYQKKRSRQFHRWLSTDVRSFEIALDLASFPYSQASAHELSIHLLEVRGVLQPDLYNTYVCRYVPSITVRQIVKMYGIAYVTASWIL